MLYLPTIIGLLVRYGPEAVQIAEIYGPPAVKFAQAVWPLIKDAIDKQASERSNIQASLVVVGHPAPASAAEDFLTSRLSAMA